MLHALEERLEHPVTGEELLLRTAWPRHFGDFAVPRGHEWSILNR
jgi:23S rRNA pseudouridine1911/1915/1917 synthase